MGEHAAPAARLLPEPAGREKIVFLFDLDGGGGGDAGAAQRSIEVLKECVALIVHTKARMRPDHQYALLVLLEGAVLYSDFTHDAPSFLQQVVQLSPSGPFTTLDLSSAYQVLLDFRRAPDWQVDDTLRAVLLYTRHSTVPTFSGGEAAWAQLSGDPSFYLDTLYVQASSPEGPQGQGSRHVFASLTSLDRPNTPNHGRCYAFQTPSESRAVLRCAAHLVAHARQRPARQGDLANALPPPLEAPEGGGVVAGGHPAPAPAAPKAEIAVGGVPPGGGRAAAPPPAGEGELGIPVGGVGVPVGGSVPTGIVYGTPVQRGV